MTILTGTIQKRNGTAAQWEAANPILLQGEEGLETDTRRTKTGDGNTEWNDLSYDDELTAGQSGIISGGGVTVVSDDATVAAATYYIEGEGTFSSPETAFNNIALSSSGTQRFVAFYGNTSSTVTKVEGSESALAVMPSTPADTVLLGYILVTDAAVSETPDLSGYLLRADKATAATNLAGTNDTTYVTPLANVIKANLASPTFTGTPAAPTASFGTNTTQLATTAFVQANKPDLGYNVKEYGVTGDGSTNDRNALNTLLTSTAPSGSTIYFPPGTYLINTTGITITRQFIFKGHGATIKTASNIILFLFQGGAERTEFHDLKFLGNDTGTNQFGMYFQSCAPFTVNRCTFTDLGGGGVAVNTSNATAELGGIVMGCRFYSGNVGVSLEALAEYIQIVGCEFTSMTLAIKSVAGNTLISNCNINYCTTGVEIASGTNNGHGIISNNQINHCATYGLNIHDTALGMTLMGNHVYQSPIRIATTTGVRFYGGTLDSSAYTFDANTALKFVGVFFDAAYANTITLSSGNHPEFIDCYYLGGKSFNYPTAATTNATVTTLHTLAIPASTTFCIEGYVVGRRTGGSSGTSEDCALYRVEFVAKNIAGTATVVGSSVTAIGESQAGWDVTVTASTSNVLIQVTGASNNNISWGWNGRPITS